jgi:hypothetical protein
MTPQRLRRNAKQLVPSVSQEMHHEKDDFHRGTQIVP